ncbi:hypothetical protein B296_00046967, partial [Ensete ventricosum]
MDARGFFIGARGMCWLLETSAGRSKTLASIYRLLNKSVCGSSVPTHFVPLQLASFLRP